jgi:carbon starvation protein CstA
MAQAALVLMEQLQEVLVVQEEQLVVIGMLLATLAHLLAVDYMAQVEVADCKRVESVLFVLFGSAVDLFQVMLLMYNKDYLKNEPVYSS